MKRFSVLFVLLCICGCSPQKRLAQRLKGADRVIVTNSVEDFSLAVTGEDLDRLVHVMALGKKVSPLTKTGRDFRLEFFTGNQHLESVAASDFHFLVGNDLYSDTTETLKSLSERFYETNRVRLRR